MPIAVRCARTPWKIRSGRSPQWRNFRAASSSYAGSVEQAEDRGAGHVVAEAVGALERHFDEVLSRRRPLRGPSLARHTAGEAQGVVGKARHAQANREILDHRFGT